MEKAGIFRWLVSISKYSLMKNVDLVILSYCKAVKFKVIRLLSLTLE